MRKRARTRAREVLARDVEMFAAAGYEGSGRREELHASLSGPEPALRLELVPTGGRVFGGAYALEVSSAEPVLLPSTAGLRAKGRGVVRMQGIDFRARRDDPAGTALAGALSTDASLIRALGAVHFEQIRVEADGRAVIRHMGGSLVWLLFPPMTRPIGISDEQVRATADAIRAFAAAGRRSAAG
ncbi:MAG TPA: DUF3156 family protein [Actinomycetota bacterium]|nr:DUF3156 family protein [Actinomycetota bacterium]